MHKKFSNIPFYIIFGVTLILIIIGYFFDLKISETIYIGRDNGFCRFFAAVGVGIPFMGFCLFGGYLFGDTLVNRKKSFFKLILLMYAIGMTTCGWLVASNEFSGYNAYNLKHAWIAFLCAIPLALVIFYIGYISGKKNTNEKLWLIIVLMPIVVVLSYGFFTSGLKYTIHRPRYREMIDGTLDTSFFHKLFSPFKEYKDYIELGTNSDEFKSFPSGHACTSCLMVMMLSYLSFIYPKLESKRNLLFYIGLAYTIFISITRLISGAHFLTDVCVGFLSTLLCIFILNNIIDKKIYK